MAPLYPSFTTLFRAYYMHVYSGWYSAHLTWSNVATLNVKITRNVKKFYIKG